MAAIIIFLSGVAIGGIFHTPITFLKNKMVEAVTELAASKK